MPVLRLLAFAACFGLVSQAVAADHADGPAAQGAPEADINDLFAFVSPADANRLVFIDRAGRAAITSAIGRVLTLGGMDAGPILDAYNRDHNSDGWVEAWGASAVSVLETLDTLDGVVGNTAIEPAVLGPALVGDFLIIDAAKPYSNAGYLSQELVIFNRIPAEAASSGGRSLSQNVADMSLSVLTGFPLDANWDCVDENDVAFPDAFPWLAPAHAGE